MEKFNTEEHWDGFVKDKVVVNCKTEELAKDFFTYCSGRSITWVTGLELTETNWTIYQENTCYYCFGNNLSYGSLENVLEKNYKVVSFEGFNRSKKYAVSELTYLKLTDPSTNKILFETNFSSIPTKTTKETIEIIYHRKETIVLIKTNGKYYKGVARCHTEDAYDKEQGFAIAYQRARDNQQRLNISTANQENLQEEVSLCGTCKHSRVNSGKPCYDRWLKMGGKVNKYACWEKQ